MAPAPGRPSGPPTPPGTPATLLNAVIAGADPLPLWAPRYPSGLGPVGTDSVPFGGAGVAPTSTGGRSPSGDAGSCESRPDFVRSGTCGRNSRSTKAIVRTAAPSR